MACSRAPADGPVTSVAVTGARMASSGVFLAQLAGFDAQLLELAVQVGTLEAGLFGDAGHGTAFAAQVVLEIHALEGVARLAQRQVEGQRVAMRVRLAVA